MSFFLNPRLYLVTTLLPFALLTLVYQHKYRLVKHALEAEHQTYWMVFSIALLALTLGILAYCVKRMRDQLPLQVGFAIVSFFVLTTYAFVVLFNHYHLIPSSIPGWLMDREPTYTFGSFIVIPILHSLLISIFQLTPDPETKSAGKSFLITAAMPFIIYTGFEIGQVLSNDGFIFERILPVLGIALSVLFLFMLGRSIYILSSRKAAWFRQYIIYFKILIGIVFPFLGLFLNDHLEGQFGDDKGIWGDFSSQWFYVLAIVNGILFCIPDYEHIKLRFVLFILRSMSLVYIVYFALIFMPFLPFSVLFIILFGTGILMLTPIILLIMQIMQLRGDMSYLKEKGYTVFKLNATLLLGLWVIPAGISWSFLEDQKTLHKGLDYLYTTPFDVKETPAIDPVQLNYVLNTRYRSDRMSLFTQNSTQPFIGSYYQWLVLDNLQVSQRNRLALQSIFECPSLSKNNQDFYAFPGKSIPQITHHQIESHRDENGLHHSSIYLEITNQNIPNAEYFTNFDLPAGCWIENYYLWVHDVKEPGILAEKKSADWIYNEIRTIRRDPGKLTYSENGDISFRVFPFAQDEKRKTEICLVHHDPVHLTIDGIEMTLGSDDDSKPEIKTSANGHLVLINAEAKKSLPLVQRQPYYHFMLDCSDSLESIRLRVESAKDLIVRQPAHFGTPRFTLIDGSPQAVEGLDALEASLNRDDFKGGMFLQRALEQLFYEEAVQPDMDFPIPVVVVTRPETAIILPDFQINHANFPEYQDFYWLGSFGELRPWHRAGEYDAIETDSQFVATPVRAWPESASPMGFVSDNGQSDYVYLDKGTPTGNTSTHPGLDLEAESTYLRYHPDVFSKKWIDIVRESFRTGLMMPVTSYIVLETDVQKQAMLEKQATILAGKYGLNSGDDFVNMDEPDMWLILVLFAGLLIIRKIWKGVTAL